MYGWMNRHLKLAQKEPITEKPFKPVPPKELSVFDEQHPLPKDALNVERLRANMTAASDAQIAALIPKNEASLKEYRRVIGTALRTWKRWLFDLIDSRDFRDEHGRWLRVSEDLACMFPMLEMATTRRAHHIAEPLMLYNRLSHHDPKRRLAEEGIRNAAWLRTKPRYAPLSFTNADEQSSLQTEVRFSA